MYSRIRMKPEQLRLLFISDPASNPLRLITYLELGFTVNYHQEKR